MSEIPPEGACEPRQESKLASRIYNLFEVILVACTGFVVIPLIFSWVGIGTLDLLGSTRNLTLLLFSEATVTLLLILLLLFLRGEGLTSIGWRRGTTLSEMALGLAVVPGLFAITLSISVLFRIFFPDYATEKNPLLDLIRTPGDLFLLLLSSIYVGGLKEELQRAFVLRRFQENLGGPVVGLVLWSIFFGIGHLVQGVDNAVGAAALGLAFGAIFLWRGSLTSPIVAHSLYDIATLTAYWFIYLPGGIKTG